MKTKTKEEKKVKILSLVETIVQDYLEYLEDLSDEEYFLCISLLLPLENARFCDFENALGQNLTRTRSFLFICNEIDYYDNNDEKALHEEVKKTKKKAKSKVKL